MHLRVTADQRRLQSFNSSQPARYRFRAQHAVCLHRLNLALYLNATQVFEVEEGRDQFVGGPRDLYRARRGTLFHARGHVDRITHGRVLEGQICAHRADDDHAGIDPHTDVEGNAVTTADLLPVSIHLLHYFKRG